jgi:ElaB/YqjD/DUF883 family membrane-anchored ribosome-binding protein
MNNPQGGFFMDDIRRFTKGLEDKIEKVRDRVGEAKERIEEFADEATSRSQKTWKDAQKYLQKNPAQSLGIALVVGALFGALMRGGRKRK